MAQVVRPQGWIGPLVTFVIGIILLFNGVPALVQWLPWIAQSALLVGMDQALETALVPLLLAGAATFIGFLMMRGGFSSLRQLVRGASSRATEQARTGVRQARREVTQRSGELSSQAEHLVNRVPQSWRERIEAAASAVERERAQRAGASAGQQQAIAAQGQRAQYGQDSRQGQAQQAGEPYLGQGRQQGQGQQPGQSQRMQQANPQRQQQAPGGQRLQRIDELRQRVDARQQQVLHAEQQVARAAADQTRRAAGMAADRAAQVLPQRLDAATEALVGALDIADAERVRRRGSTLVRSSLTTGALSKTSLRTNSLFRHR